LIGIGRLGTRAALFAPDSRRCWPRTSGSPARSGNSSCAPSGWPAPCWDSVPPTPPNRFAALSRNCVELVELYLGTAKAGGLLFPLNWRLSAEQIEQALTDAAPSVVFYAAEYRPVVDQVALAGRGAALDRVGARRGERVRGAAGENRGHGVGAGPAGPGVAAAPAVPGHLHRRHHRYPEECGAQPAFLRRLLAGTTWPRLGSPRTTST